jgi:hypothetical protein
MSAEHYFSRSSFPDGAMVRLPGWTEARPLGPAAMTTKVLCEVHNSALSPLDQFAGVYRCVGAEMVVRDVERKAHPHRDWLPYTFTLPGLLFERWMFKVSLGLMPLVARLPGAQHLRGWQPTPELARYVLGQGPLPPRTGLGYITVPRMQVHMYELHRFTVDPLGGPHEAGTPEPVSGFQHKCPGGLIVWVLWGEDPEERNARLGNHPHTMMRRLNQAKNADNKLRLEFDWSPHAELLADPHVANAVRKHG